MKRTETQIKGLSSAEAGRRLREQGKNLLSGGRKKSAATLFASQFKDVMVLILLAATAVSVVLGDTSEALVIIAIVILNSILGFIQEYRTERSLEALRRMAAPTARVIRDGQRIEIPASDVVTGDYVTLEAGDRIPADCRLDEAVALSCDESMITGESVPVSKRTGEAVYMGTTLSQGRGGGVVTATGMATEMGRIAGMLDEIEEEATPLQTKLNELGRYIAAGCLIICLIISVAGVLRGENIMDMLLVGISLAVAAIPEGLPAIVTISLALAVRRILSRNALVRRLHTVETLGCADIICTDKTGTLTENRMTVKELYAGGETVLLSGGGSSADGEFTTPGGRILRPERSVQLTRLLEIALMCNSASLELVGGGGLLGSRRREECRCSGDPTETALLVAGAKARLYAERLPYLTVGELPFDPVRKMMSVVVKGRDGSLLLFTKGAPDLLLERCSYCMTGEGVAPLTSSLREQIARENTRMASNALRVLGFAFRAAESADESRIKEHGLVFVGLMGMLDPPRKEAYKAVLDCRRAGIRTIMITGDHKNTACAIAADLKIMADGDNALTGAQLEAMDDSQLTAALERTSVFARVSPRHKLRIVRCLKARGHIVAMTGDGVNDAPAIKEADIGVSMGLTGTDVSREASSLVLLDDNFATMVAAVEEGRVIYRNIRKFIRYLMSCNIGEVVTMFAGMLMGLPMVLLPIQILLVNLVTDGLPAMALGVEPAEEDVMRRLPRGREESVFSGGLLTTILFRGCLIGLTTLAVFSTFLIQGCSLETARTGGLLTLVTTQLFHVFECKSERKTLFEINPFDNWKLLLAALLSAGISLAAVYHPWLSALFLTKALTLNQLSTVVVFSLAAPVLSSVVTIFGRFGKKRPQLENIVQ